MMEKIESRKVVSIGGLNSNVNHIQLSDNEPGSAVNLLNFEASLYGGYRRLSGFQPLLTDYEIVDSAGAEGRILLSAIFEDLFIVARKQQSGDTYDFYSSDGTAWAKMATGLTRSSLGVTRIRWRTFNFNGTQKIVFVDGVNPACVYDGTTWTEITSSATGADYANAGGDQAIDTPRYVEVFKNHIFLAGDHLVVHSAPLAEYDFTAANGAGQIPSGFAVNSIKVFREALFVFGVRNIKKIEVSNTSFVLNDVTADIGCLAPDSTVEIGGSLVFLSQDGIRPISATDRIGDIELETVSKKIQQLISQEIVANDMSEVTSVIIRGKSQVRFFFSSEGVNAEDTFGIIGCLRGSIDGSIQWEWGRLQGISCSCVTSGYIGAVEYIIHGDYLGGVYRQEVGNDFNGSVVPAVYTTPYLDFGDAGIRKTMRGVRLFVRPEGQMVLGTQLSFDWGEEHKLNPASYAITSLVDPGTVYGSATYGTTLYTEAQTPVLLNNVEGSGFSVQVTYTTNDTSPPYTIQGTVYEYSVEGRK